MDFCYYQHLFLVPRQGLDTHSLPDFKPVMASWCVPRGTQGCQDSWNNCCFNPVCQPVRLVLCSCLSLSSAKELSLPQWGRIAKPDMRSTGHHRGVSTHLSVGCCLQHLSSTFQSHQWVTAVGGWRGFALTDRYIPSSHLLAWPSSWGLVFKAQIITWHFVPFVVMLTCKILTDFWVEDISSCVTGPQEKKPTAQVLFTQDAMCDS